MAGWFVASRACGARSSRSRSSRRRCSARSSRRPSSWTRPRTRRSRWPPTPRIATPPNPSGGRSPP